MGIVENALTQQPQYAAGVNLGNEFGRSVVALLVGTGGDALAGLPFKTNATINQIIGSFGLATSASTESGASSVSTVNAPGISTEDCTDFCLVSSFAKAGGSVFRYACGTYDGGSNGFGITIEHLGISSNWGLLSLGSSLSGTLLSSGEDCPALGGLLVAVRKAGTYALYRDGILKASTSATSGNASSTAKFCQNNLQETGGAFSTTAGIALSGRLSRGLSAEEVAAFSANVWQIFQAPPIDIWVPSAGSGAQNLTPALVTNTNSFYASTVAPGVVDLTPGLFTNSNSFYSPSVSVGTVNLTPSLFTSANSFYSPTVSLASGPQTLSPSLFTNSNSFYSASVTTGSVDLTPLLFTNSSSFYSPTVSLGGVSLLPSLFSNTNSFYAPTVSPGLVNLVASLFTNSSTFYGHTVAQPSLQNLTSGFYSNYQSFYTHYISAGTTLSPADLLAIADAVWAHPEALTVAKFLGLK